MDLLWKCSEIMKSWKHSVSIKASVNMFMFHSVDIYLGEFEFDSIFIYFEYQHDPKVVPKTDLSMT